PYSPLVSRRPVSRRGKRRNARPNRLTWPRPCGSFVARTRDSSRTSSHLIALSLTEKHGEWPIRPKDEPKSGESSWPTGGPCCSRRRNQRSDAGLRATIRQESDPHPYFNSCLTHGLLKPWSFTP